jgi:hypothetical protein
MYQLIRNSGLKAALLHEAPTLIASMAVAEVFYKWHSFTLECLGFLATWSALSLVEGLIFRRKKEAT